MLRRPLIVLLAALTFLTGCSAPEQAEESERLVVEFRGLLDREAYDDIWQLTSIQFRRQNLKSETLEFFRTVRAKLGPTRESVKTDFNLQNEVGELPTITLFYQTEFERGYGEETFVFTVNEGRMELWGYHINSNDLALQS